MTALGKIIDTMQKAIAASTPLSRAGLRFERGPSVASLERTATPARSRIFDVYAGRVAAIGGYLPSGYEVEQEITAEVSYQIPSQDEAWRVQALECAEDLAAITAIMLHPDRQAECEPIEDVRLVETAPIARQSGRVFVRATVAVLYSPQSTL